MRPVTIDPKPREFRCTHLDIVADDDVKSDKCLGTVESVRGTCVLAQLVREASPKMRRPAAVEFERSGSHRL